MNYNSDDQLAHYRAASDRAFLEMQQNADREMADFMSRYGGEVGDFKTAPSIFSAKTVLTTHTVTPRTSEQKSYPTNPGPAAQRGRESSFAGLNKEHFEDSVDDLKQDFQALGKGLRVDAQASAEEALVDTKNILRTSALSLGQKAKEEALALKEAMKKAMEEERNLKSMQGRAAEELRKTKERLRGSADAVKADALDDLQKMAQGRFDQLQGKAGEAFSAGQDSIEREWDDFTKGLDTR